MNSDTITLNETLKLHEIAMAKVLCANKFSAMLPLIQDEELKTLINQDIEAAKKDIVEIKNLLLQSSMVKNQNI